METKLQFDIDDITTIPIKDFPAFVNSNSIEKKTNVYSIIDAAQDEAIYPMLKSSKWNYSCLYKKNVHFEGDRMCEELAATAPYLVVLDPNKMQVERFIQERIGRNQIIVFESEAAEQEINDHCSSMLKAMDEDGKVINFRCYDPRILRVYLPTCTDEEIFIFFGNIDTIWVEGGDEEVLEFEKEYKKEAIEEEPEQEPSLEEEKVESTNDGAEDKKDIEIEPVEGYGVMGAFCQDN